MADGDYVRLAPVCHTGEAKRFGHGGARPGAGRKPGGSRVAPKRYVPVAPRAAVCVDCGAQVLTKASRFKRCVSCRKAKPVDRAADRRVCALAACGQIFAASIKSPQKYCSAECRILAGNEAAKTCAVRVCETCAQEYRAAARDRKRWCSDACRAKALRGLFSCLHCKAEFTPKTKRSGEGEKYCSRQCAYAARAAEPIRGVCAYYAKACTGCGRPGGKRRDWTRCEACLAEDRRRKASDANRAAAEAMHRAAARVTTCAECQTTYCRLYGNKEKRFGGRVQLCSAACQESRRIAGKRVAKSTRAARKRGDGKAERIDPLAVFARDGWRCQLCKRKTPKAKRGTCADDAPELDHIVPLSKGGPHSLTNVQCACRACNNEKGSKPLGQLLLIG